MIGISGAETGVDALTAGIIGALVGSLLTLAGDAFNQRRIRRRAFGAQMRALADEIEEVGRLAQKRVESSDPFPTGPPLPRTNWQTISTSSEVHLISNRYRQLGELYRKVDSANHSLFLAENFSLIAKMASDPDTKAAYRELAERHRIEPFNGIKDLSQSILNSLEFRKWTRQ